MHIKCPNCGAVASLDILLAAEDGASEVVKISGEMQPSLFKLATQYLGLFRPLKTSKLSWSRTAKILGELHQMVKAAEFEHGKQRYIAPLAYWQTAIEQVLAQREKLTLPLNGHGYLLKIMMSIDAKTIKDTPKTVTEQSQSTPVEQTPPPQAAPRNDPPSRYLEPPKEVMSKEEGLKALANLSQKLGAKLPTRTVTAEDIDQQTQHAKAQMQHLLNQELATQTKRQD